MPILLGIRVGQERKFGEKSENQLNSRARIIARIHATVDDVRNFCCWHNPDLRLAASEGPLTITFRTLSTEGMRTGLQGLTGLYGVLSL